MAVNLIHGNKLGVALHAEGLVPPNAKVIDLVIPATGAIMLRFECYVPVADLPKIARALLAVEAAERPTD